jgi:quercetin dioxygenase-like cupin family protein
VAALAHSADAGAIRRRAAAHRGGRPDRVGHLKAFDFDSAATSPIGPAANVTPLAAGESAHVVCIRLGPGGVLPRHPAAADQLFVVVQGHGWASGGDGAEQEITAGTAVFWEAGEEHETRTDGGLTAIVVEAEQLGPG